MHHAPPLVRPAFERHTRAPFGYFPPMHTAFTRLIIATAIACATPAVAWGQAKPAVPTTGGVPSSTPRGADKGPVPPKPVGPAPVARPPISPRRAFLYSVLVPGAGQAALDRHVWGGAFFLVEGLSLALVYRSAEELRLARQFRADSVPLTYQTGSDGAPVLGADGKPAVATWSVSMYSAARVRARRTHYEDWIAVVIFNHLMSGADAFVAAQLWDLPARVSLQPAADGRPAITASLKFR